MHACELAAAYRFAHDRSRLKAPGVTAWSVRDGNEVVGIGALKEVGHGSAEVERCAPIPIICAVTLLLEHIMPERERLSRRVDVPPQLASKRTLESPAPQNE